MSAVKMRTPVLSASSLASLVTGTSNARMTAYCAPQRYLLVTGRAPVLSRTTVRLTNARHWPARHESKQAGAAAAARLLAPLLQHHAGAHDVPAVHRPNVDARHRNLHGRRAQKLQQRLQRPQGAGLDADALAWRPMCTLARSRAALLQCHKKTAMLSSRPTKLTGCRTRQSGRRKQRCPACPPSPPP